LKTEVGKGSRPTAVGPGLASPEGSGNSVTNGRLGAFVLISPAMIPKGNPVKILEPHFGL